MTQPQGGSAQPVALSSGAQSGGAAVPVYEVTDGRATVGGPAQPVYVVTSGPMQGGTPMPVVTAAAGAVVSAGPAIPVYVVSGVIGDVLPVNTALPVITGATTIGSLLSSTTGTWTGPPTGYAYQWKRGGVAIGGATASTYTLVNADNGTTITVTVTASNAIGSTAATSAGTAISNLPVNTVLPVISGGTAAAISTTDGTWTGPPTITFTYQWKRNGANIGGATASTYSIVAADIGTTTTVAVTATNAAGAVSATSAGYTPTYTQKVLTLAPIAYWPMAEPSGTTALDASGNGRTGTYTGVTLGVTGIGDGRTAASFDGATSKNNVFSASLAAAFGSAEGSIILWAKVSAVGVWSDGIVRRFITLQVDANNRAYIEKVAGANTFGINYVAGGTAKNRNRVTTTVAYFHVTMTWSKSNDRAIMYFNGVQEGATLTALGTWVGTIVNTNTNVGANATTPTSVWSGSLAHAAVFARELTAAEALSAATP